MRLRVGIIGAGQAGERQAIGFCQAADADVVAIADIDPARAAAVAAAVEATAGAASTSPAVYTDWRAMLAAKVDVVAICLPHNLHVEPACEAARHGIHVMLEKPIAITMADAKRIVAACEEAGIKLTVSYVHRFREEVVLLQRWLRSGRIGKPLTARETMNGQRGPHLGSWVNDPAAAGGGVVMYSAIHGIDRLRWLMDDEIVRVTAQTRNLDGDGRVEQSALALLTFAGGAVAVLSAAAPEYPARPSLWETEVFGSGGLVRARTRAWAEISDASEQQRHETGWCREQFGVHYNFARQAASFLAAIRADTEPPVSAEDGLRSLAVVQAIYASAAQEGTSVVVDY